MSEWRFKLVEPIGKGSFGEIYKGYDSNKNEEVAIKMEDKSVNKPQLLYESRIYRMISGAVGFGKVKWYGNYQENNALVLTLFGKSLEELFNECNRQFSLKTVLMIGEQSLERIWYLHLKGVIHRDIKPQNFLIGLKGSKEENIIHLIDFGLSKEFRDCSGKHVKYGNENNIVGTARYASINTHLGINNSRRDDLESLGYMLIYFLKGSLPWSGLNEEMIDDLIFEISKVKLTTSIKELCRGLPKEIEEYISAVRSLRYEDEPDYIFLLELFESRFKAEGFIYDYIYDWNLI